MITLGSVTLSDNLLWIDEFESDQVAQNQVRLIGGGQLIEETPLLKGRPITLGGGAGWISRTTLIALRTLEAAGAETYTLTLNDARTFQVAFRRPNAIRAVPVIPQNNPTGSDFYDLTLQLIEV